MDNLTPADIKAVTGGDDGMFGGSWGMILILFLILTMAS